MHYIHELFYLISLTGELTDYVNTLKSDSILFIDTYLNLCQIPALHKFNHTLTVNCHVIVLNIVLVCLTIKSQINLRSGLHGTSQLIRIICNI